MASSAPRWAVGVIFADDGLASHVDDREQCNADCRHRDLGGYRQGATSRVEDLVRIGERHTKYRAVIA